MDDLLTTKQLADLLSVSSGTIKNWLNSGKIRGIRNGRNWKIKKSEVQDIIDNGLLIDKPEKLGITQNIVKEIIAKELKNEIIPEKTIQLMAAMAFGTIREKNVTITEVELLISKVIKDMREQGLF